MVEIRFIEHEGHETTCDVDVGLNLMEAALNNGIDGIVADCGGALSCATCHVYVDKNWQELLGEPSEEEEEMLEFAIDRLAESRLSCQIVVSEAMAGLAIRVPERQQ